MELSSLAADKQDAVHETKKTDHAQIQAGCHLPNHTNFGPPMCDITNAAFGTIRSTFPTRQVLFALQCYSNKPWRQFR